MRSSTSPAIELVRPYMVIDYKRFSGVLNDKIIPVGSIITIKGIEFKTVQAKLVEFSLFTVGGKLSMEHNNIKYRGQPKIKAFLESVGIASKESFTRNFFQNPTIKDTVATILVWYCPFKQTNYF